jgi:iron complex outermembrane receptor protein
VAEGPSLGGAINAELVQAQFTDNASLTPQLRMASQYRSVDDSYAIGGLAALASERWRFGLIASREQGDDYRFPGGTAVGTSFERNLYGVHAGFQTGAGELFVEYRRSETDPSGNPPFALDIVYINTDFVLGGFRGQIAEDVGLTVRLGHVAVRHLLDNQTLRQPAAAPMQARDLCRCRHHDGRGSAAFRGRTRLFRSGRGCRADRSLRHHYQPYQSGLLHTVSAQCAV